MKTYQTIIINLIVIFLIVAVPLIVISKDNPEKQKKKYLYAFIVYFILSLGFLLPSFIKGKFYNYDVVCSVFIMIGAIFSLVKLQQLKH